jgi:transcriptional antiterminator NusG
MDWREKLKSITEHTDEDESQIWHVIFVMTGNEDIAKRNITYALKNTVIQAVVPKRCINERKNGIWREAIKPLFPGYILLRGNISTEDYYILKSIPDILRVLKDNCGLQRIHPNEIKIINRLMCNGDLIGTSIGLQQGDSIRIIEGPLLGLEGLIMSIDRRKGRARVKLSILGDERTIDLGIKLIKTI